MTGFASDYNDITENLMFTGGVLNGTIGNPAHETTGRRYYITTNVKSPKYTHDYYNPVTHYHGLLVPATRPDGQPFTAEQAALWRTLTSEEALFYKFFNKSMAKEGLQPSNFMVAAIDLQDANTTDDCTVSIEIRSSEFATSYAPNGLLYYSDNVYFNPADPNGSSPLDDAVKPGDANMDNLVNMGDVTVIEKMILGLKSPNAQADVNGNAALDMGDVVRLERTLLGLK